MSREGASAKKSGIQKPTARWNFGKAGFKPFLPLLLGILLLTLAFAPVGQFYLAWVGLVPWLVLLQSMRSQRAAFFWNWIGGTLFFSANMWWMANISLPGMIALMVYCGIYWGFAALVIRGLGIIEWRGKMGPIAALFCVAAIWSAGEWLRGSLMTGLPWLFLGHSQTPVLALCQIADITSVYGISFFLVMFNTLVALFWLNRTKIMRVIPAAVLMIFVIGIVSGYGAWRIGQTASTTRNGPTVALIQPNWAQSNSGSKGVPIDERVNFHVNKTVDVLEAYPHQINLVVWSETMMSPINEESLLEDIRLKKLDGHDHIFAQVHGLIADLCQVRHISILTGAEYMGSWTNEVRNGKTERIALDRRNSAFLFDRIGNSVLHYDKVHLVPFGEFIPFKQTVPFLYHIFVWLGPQYYNDYELESGHPDQLTVFDIPDVHGNTWRFCTPICFEDIDSRICSAMVRPAEGSTFKRVDFLANLTNDGWFKANQNAQHFQAAQFRAIENRVPLARSVNTGISGFIDSTGRAENLLAARTEGTTTMQLKVDSRVTFYTMHGDIFAGACIAMSAVLVAFGLARRFPRRG